MSESSNVLRYKKVIPSKISLMPPIKNSDSGCYESVVIYGGNKDLLVQTPSMSVDYTSGALDFSYSEEKFPQFSLFLTELRECVIENLFAKSEIFFRGKKFSREDLDSRISQFFYPSENKKYNLLNFKVSGEVKNIQDDLGDHSKFTCILKIEKIIFNKHKVILESRIMKHKISNKQKFTISDECALGDDCSDTVNEDDELC